MTRLVNDISMFPMTRLVDDIAMFPMTMLVNVANVPYDQVC